MRRQTIRWPPDPIDRQSEVMFGLRMTLTFTGPMRLALGAEAMVREILLAALGCNIALGLVDATIYLQTAATPIAGEGACRRLHSGWRPTPRQRRRCPR
jgi:hypothetical protein